MEAMTCEELMRKIKELEFTAVELNLYLDNHPTNQKALDDFNKVTEELTRVKRMYELNFGPLTNYGTSPSQYPWRWVNEPWPWQSGE
jgi:spore coat protein JB